MTRNPPSLRNVPTKDERTWQRSILRARFDPVWFAREVLQLKHLPGEPRLTDPFPQRLGSWELDPWQVEMLEACADVVRKTYGKPTKVNHAGKNIISARALQGPGKTFGLALVLHWYGFAFRSVMPCTAPKIEHLKTRLWKEFRKILSRAQPGYARLLDVKATRITWADDPDWTALAETGAQPESMQGLRGLYTLVGVDEASGVPEQMFPVVMGNLSATKIGILLMIGNPTRNLGFFADSHRRKETAHDTYRMHIGPQNTSRVPQAWIDQMIRSYGRNSPAVLVRCFGEFAEDDRHQLISTQWIADAFSRPARDDGALPRLRISVDVADGGEDETIITAALHYPTGVHMLKQAHFNFPSSRAPILSAQAAENMMHGFRTTELDGQPYDMEFDFVVDAIGVGAGTAGWLMEQEYPVIPYKGGEQSSDPAQWRNRRVQSYIGLRNAFRDGRISIAADFVEERTHEADLEAQLCSIRTKPGTERVEDLQTKEEMLREGIKSPDRADSMAMQYATQAPTLARPVPSDAQPVVVTSDAWSAY